MAATLTPSLSANLLTDLTKLTHDELIQRMYFLNDKMIVSPPTVQNLLLIELQKVKKELEKRRSNEIAEANKNWDQVEGIDGDEYNDLMEENIQAGKENWWE